MNGFYVDLKKNQMSSYQDTNTQLQSTNPGRGYVYLNTQPICERIYEENKLENLSYWHPPDIRIYVC
jgi:hypothetical protein